jgi:uncharacterized protein with HEPN domain
LVELIAQMRESATNALVFTDGLSQSDFLTDLRTQHAVAMCITVIGETATRVLADFPDFAAQHPEIPWTSIRGMRNRIAHGYFSIDQTIVWDTLRPGLADLLSRLSNLGSV